jgi:hypothetical protein
LLILSASTIIFCVTIWLFIRNPKNYFKTKTDINIPDIILDKFPPHLTPNFDEQIFYSLPSHLSNMSAILMIYVFPYQLWAKTINEIIGQITNVNNYYFLKSNKEEAFKMKGQLYVEIYEFLNNFKMCLQEKDIDKCSLIMWETGKKIDSDRIKVDNLLSSP